MNALTNIMALSWMNLKTIPARAGASLVIVIGIAGVVAVLTSLLSIARGFEQTMSRTGQPGRVLLLRKGSTSEINGNIPIDQFGVIDTNPMIARQGREPLAAMETYVTVKLTERSSGNLSSVPMRGISARSLLVRPELKFVEGRPPKPGTYELVASKRLADRMTGLALSNEIRIRGTNWRVVGLFETGGGAYESELMVDERLLASLHGRGPTFSSALVQLSSPLDFDAFEAEVESDRRLSVDARLETGYYEAQSRTTVQMMTALGILISAIMSIGAVFAAMNTMYAAVSSRTVEIATLKAVGFRPGTIFATILIESFFLSLAGGLIGAGATWLALDGYALSSAGGGLTKVSFSFMLSPSMVIAGITTAILLGLIGGAIPAFFGVRRPIVDGLKDA